MPLPYSKATRGPPLKHTHTHPHTQYKHTVNPTISNMQLHDHSSKPATIDGIPRPSPRAKKIQSSGKTAEWDTSRRVFLLSKGRTSQCG